MGMLLVVSGRADSVLPTMLILAAGRPSRHPTVTAQNNNHKCYPSPSAGRSRIVVNGAKLSKPEKPPSTVDTAVTNQAVSGTLYMR